MPAPPVSEISTSGGKAVPRISPSIAPRCGHRSLGLWTTYELEKWTFGYGATYQGSFVTQNSSLPTVNGTTTQATLDNPTAAQLYETPDYWVHRAMVGYQFNQNFGLQLNINNLTDKEYYTRIRNNATSGWATPGETRSAVLTATYRF